MITSRRRQCPRGHGLAVAGLAVCLAPWSVYAPLSSAQDAGDLQDEEFLDDGPDAEVIPPQEPMTLREELFLAIELRDANAARAAIERGADREINLGDPSPLATAALHDNLRMVVLLLESGGDPAATLDNPLEEAVRNENSRMVELLMRSGARVGDGPLGAELFRLAQRGGAAKELSRILLDHGGAPGQCLTAATAQARVELMKYCLRRGADPTQLPVALDVLGVALASDDPEAVDLVLAGGVTEPMRVAAFAEAVAAGRVDLAEQALAAGAVPAFEHVEAAIENSRPEMALFLLDREPVDGASLLAGGDAAALRQRASDLGFDRVAAAIQQKSGGALWNLGRGWPMALGLVAATGLIWLLARRRDRPPPPPAAEPSQRRSRASRRPAAPRPAAPRPPAPSPETATESAPAPARRDTQPRPPAAAPAAAAARPPAPVELRMPEVDLSRDADKVFDAARAASSGETVRPDAPDRAQIVLVTPARITMLQSCPAPGSLKPEQLAAAEQLATAPARNVAVIAFTDLDAMSQQIEQAIPFFELLRKLGYLGHAVWIFEGHVSAMAAGCRDADLLIVDDGMIPYLPGNWRSVASGVMRGSDIHLFERQTGALRRLT